MNSEALKIFSEGLKVSREKAGISLQQIAQKTKIDIKFLAAIEDSNFDILPEIYIRAFIKEYASCIDLNPNDVIQKYDAAKLGFSKSNSVEKNAIEKEKIETEVTEKEIIEKEEPAKLIEDESIKISEENKNKVSPSSNGKRIEIKLNYIIGGLILLAAFAILYFSIIYNPNPEIVTENTTEENQSSDSRFEVENLDTAKVNASSNIEETTNIQPDSLNLSIETLGDVWIKVIKDGKNVHQKMVPKDSKLKFKAKEKFSVSVGNAGAVRILYNGKELQNFGKIGEIKNVVITPDTIKFLTIKRDDKKSDSAKNRRTP
jgi:cytoskeletal protein RodZ